MGDLARLTIRIGLTLLAAGLCLNANGRADVFRTADFSLTLGPHGHGYVFSAELPVGLDVYGVPNWPGGCEAEGTDRSAVGGRVRYDFALHCPQPFGPGDTVLTPWPVDAARLVSTALGPRVDLALIGDGGGVRVPVGEVAANSRPFTDVVRLYFAQGTFHIWAGWDHLAFVMCLCLMARGRRLLELVTAFTVGHSISLGLAFFEVVAVPIPPTESVIALSIAFMAREAWLARQADAASRGGAESARLFAVVAAFGLLHGLGFASALGELGVVQGERATGLVAFNLGVEAGQLVFVGVVVGGLSLLSRLRLAVPARTVAAGLAGCVGAYWTIERVAGFGLT